MSDLSQVVFFDFEALPLFVCKLKTYVKQFSENYDT